MRSNRLQKNNGSCVKRLFAALSLAVAHSAVCAAAGQPDAACRNAKNPIIILPGIMGSDLGVRFLGSFRTPCTMRSSQFTIWPPLMPDVISNIECFQYLMVPVPCLQHRDHIMWCDQPGVTMWVQQGGRDGTDTLTFKQGYSKLADFLEERFGYQLGKDLFAAPYDWRLSLQALEDAGQFDAIAKRVDDAVAANCGKKAILLGHSMGTLVALGMLHSPRFTAWRESNIMSYVALAPPFGGSTFAVATKLGGNKINLLQSLGELLQPLLNEVMYQGAKGLPSLLMMMPYQQVLGKDHVLVQTPRRNYTIGDLSSLMHASGDRQSAALLDSVHTLNNLLAKGPVPGVPTACIYGSQTATVKSWKYRSPIVPNRPAPPGSAVAAETGLGDGVVHLESLRLCHSLTNSSSIHELGTGVGHSNVLHHPSAQAALEQVLQQLLAQPRPTLVIRGPGTDESITLQQQGAKQLAVEVKLG